MYLSKLNSNTYCNFFIYVCKKYCHQRGHYQMKFINLLSKTFKPVFLAYLYFKPTFLFKNSFQNST